MKKIKKIIYLFPFLPSFAVAQIRTTQETLDRPSILEMFLSLSTFLYLILGGIGAISIIGFILAAIDYLAAGGDEERVTRSGQLFAFSLVGMLIAVCGIAAINYAKSIMH